MNNHVKWFHNHKVIGCDDWKYDYRERFGKGPEKVLGTFRNRQSSEGTSKNVKKKKHMVATLMCMIQQCTSFLAFSLDDMDLSVGLMAPLTKYID